MITSVLILLLAAGLFSAGIGRLQGIGVVPGGDRVWDTSWLLDDHGTVGGFLAGLIGYRARPSALELAGYALYILLASPLFPTPLPWRPAPPPRRRHAGGDEPRMSLDESARESNRVAQTNVVRSEQLFGQGRELIIKHGAEEYRLRITRADKLIPTQ